MSRYLCEELIDGIIERLPAKSLVRFRSVSKSWYSRISSLGFIRKHALRSAKTPQKVILRECIHFSKNGVEDVIALHGENGVEFFMNNFYIYGSCNGILCLIEKNHKRLISLWNLSIGRKLSVPNLHYGHTVVGFGFDPITDDYKILSIPFPNDEGIAQKTFLYSMKTNSWSEIAFPTSPYSHIKVLSNACLVNGALHWLVKYDPDNMVHCHIMTFDLSTNVFDKIPLPRIQSNRLSLNLIIVKGFLALISTEDYFIWIRVWRENNNVASWSEAFNLTSLGSEGVDNVFCLKSYAKDFETYNLETGIHSTLKNFSDSSYKVEMDMCVESLELLHGDLLEKKYSIQRYRSFWALWHTLCIFSLHS